MTTKVLTIVGASPDMTDAELIDMMRGMKALRERPHAKDIEIVLAIHGFDDDARELFGIPEARAFCRRLVEIGFISYLALATTISGVCEEALHCSLGALEVWLIANGRMKPTVDLSWEEFDHFTNVIVAASNERADRAVGTLKEHA